MKETSGDNFSVFRHSTAQPHEGANVLVVFEPPTEEKADLLLLAATTGNVNDIPPTWAVLDESTVDELVEHLMVWKIRKKARDGQGTV